MNIRYTIYFIGKILRIVAFIFVFPTLIALIYGEYSNLVAFLPMGVGIFVIGLLCSLKVPQDKRLKATEGFIIVALSWIIMSLAVACSYYILGEVGSFIDCFFEAVSGFTTTGASVIDNVEILSKSTNALRLFTHWVGGMGILVLVLAIMPKNMDATAMNVFKAEVPGHQVEKMTNKLTMTAKILYLIYTGLTVIVAVAFMIADMPIFDSIVHAMSIAGTGGFSVRNASIGAYNSYAIEIIATVGMVIFGINMNLFYLILIGKVVTALKSEEMHVYISMYIIAVVAISISLSVNSIYETVGESVIHSAFQAAAIMSTTGMYVENFSLWPTFAQTIILLIMFVGGSSGSTAGGIKVSRIMISGKYIGRQISLSARPHVVKTIRLEGERLDKNTVNGAVSYIVLYAMIIIVSFVGVGLFDDILVEGEGFNLLEKFTAVVSCMGNVGPAFGDLCVGNYKSFSTISKLILCFDMLAGRLEILPMLFLFNPLIWKSGINLRKKQLKNN